MASKLSEVALYLKARIELFDGGHFKDVYFGDEQNIPRVPAVSVVPNNIQREPTEARFQTTNTHSVSIAIYHAKFGSIHVSRLECLQLAEDVGEYLDADKTLGGLVINSNWTSLEPGFIVKGDSTAFVATQIEWQAISKERL